MKIAIMQPYFLPYIGYWQLMAAVDKFVVYDDIEYTKRGWINRNRILMNGRVEYITLPLRGASDYLDVGERCLADDWRWRDRDKLLRRVRDAYQRAPQFDVVFPLFWQLVMYEKSFNLFDFIRNSLGVVKDYLGIDTPLITSSTMSVDRALKGKHKVLEICAQLGADEYINPIGGVELYNKVEFFKNGVKLQFLKADDAITYKQFDNEFVPWLSILDVMMFNTVEQIQEFLKQYTLLYNDARILR